jgi:hypothetical protein
LSRADQILTGGQHRRKPVVLRKTLHVGGATHSLITGDSAAVIDVVEKHLAEVVGRTVLLNFFDESPPKSALTRVSAASKRPPAQRWR